MAAQGTPVKQVLISHATEADGAFAQLPDAQPEPVRGVFNYCLALMMVEARKAKLIETRPGEAGMISVFESSAGDVFRLAWPTMSAERETEVVATLREILNEEQL